MVEHQETKSYYVLHINVLDQNVCQQLLPEW